MNGNFIENCATCKFGDLSDYSEPCRTCLSFYASDERFPKWQPSAIGEILLLKAECTELKNLLESHPRAAKLMRNKKPFIVIAMDEPYFKKAYSMIRDEE